jgi:hypothetical protein
MMNESRDILIERLEQKLVEKEKEINEVHNTLKQSIIAELKNDMNDDPDFDKRISILEKRFKDMSLAYEGVMKELLDQKTIIHDLNEKYLKKDKETRVQAAGTETSQKLTDWHDRVKLRNEDHPPKEEITESKPQYIVAESEDTKALPKKKKDTDIIIADLAPSKSSNKNKIIVEDREDEDVVIEYKK